MTFKIAVYGVRDNEIPYFNRLNTYNFDLTLYAENLTHDNTATAANHDAVLIRANNVADRQNLTTLAGLGIKYVFTRTVAYSHIDLEAARDNNQIVAYVPGYSPYAVGEMAFTLALTLQRQTAAATVNASRGDFRVHPSYFATELHELTVGIIGTGRIGQAEAQLWRGVGAKVIGYDLYPSEAAKDVLTYVSEDQLLAESDIVSLHVPHFPGKNDGYFNADYLAKMKADAILVNTARGEIIDQGAVLQAVKDGQLAGFGTDVVINERQFFGNDFAGQSTGDADIDAMLAMYPKVLITPHIGSFTEQALTDMITTSFENFDAALHARDTPNILTK